MDLALSLEKAERSLIALLESKQAGIDDRTGKGSATEAAVVEQLLAPQLPPGIRLSKGSVVSADKPDETSPAIDRIVHDSGLATPLVHSDDHSILPIEAVIGVVEITMRLDARKLRDDITRMAVVKAMSKRRFVIPVPGTATRAQIATVEELSPRSFAVGLPADGSWKPQAIANSLREIQLELGPPTHVHGLYVIGIGFFETIPIENETESMYRVRGWVGTDRMFRFTSSFRRSLDRWPRIQPGWSAYLDEYVKGNSEVLAE